ncbi:MAG: hypothetical protein JO185_06760 [Acidobacteriaceae bacterium]|nr:hypothetical protein [Acidobacteriaceae bacterium]MBV9938666.1 hypothetical protein [Acidobacteriaceae bacterium]
MKRTERKKSGKSKTQRKRISEADKQQDKNSTKKFSYKDPDANDQVMQALYEMATSGGSTTAAIFWARTKCGMQEKGHEKKQPRTPKIPAIVIRAEEGKQA